MGRRQLQMWIRGSKESLEWLETAMQGHYERAIQPRLGPVPNNAKEAVIFNRTSRWTESGIEYEADPRQAEKLVAECGVTGTNTVASPGLRLSYDQLEKDEVLPAHLHTAFRGSAARANYLAADRLDCQLGGLEVGKWMSKPTGAAGGALERFCRSSRY